MTTIPLGEARDRLSEVVAQAEQTHDRIVITRHGRPAAVLIAAEDLSSLEETLDILTTPGEADAIREGLDDATAGTFADTEEIRKRYLG